MTWQITQQGITGRNNALYDTQDTKEHYRTQQALQDTTGHCRTLPHIIWQNTKGHYSTLQTQYSYLFWSGNFASVKQLLQLFPLCTPAVARCSLVLLWGLLHVAFPLTWLAGLFLPWLFLCRYVLHMSLFLYRWKPLCSAVVSLNFVFVPSVSNIASVCVDHHRGPHLKSSQL